MYHLQLTAHVPPRRLGHPSDLLHDTLRGHELAQFHDLPVVDQSRTADGMPVNTRELLGRLGWSSMLVNLALEYLRRIPRHIGWSHRIVERFTIAVEEVRLGWRVLRKSQLHGAKTVECQSKLLALRCNVISWMLSIDYEDPDQA